MSVITHLIRWVQQGLQYDEDDFQPDTAFSFCGSSEEVAGGLPRSMSHFTREANCLECNRIYRETEKEDPFV
jgi:hypothetical protein